MCARCHGYKRYVRDYFVAGVEHSETVDCPGCASPPVCEPWCGQRLSNRPTKGDVYWVNDGECKTWFCSRQCLIDRKPRHPAGKP